MRQLSRLALDLRARGRKRCIRGRQLGCERLRAALLRFQRCSRGVKLSPLRCSRGVGGAALLLQRRVLGSQLRVAGAAQLAQLCVLGGERGGGGCGVARRGVARRFRLGAERRQGRLRRLRLGSQLFSGCRGGRAASAGATGGRRF